MRAPLTLALISILAPACATDEGDLDIEDGEFDTATGKADSIAEGSRDAKTLLALVNDPSVRVYELDEEVGLSTRVAEAIIKHRKGADDYPNTADDDLFDSVAELDQIAYVGPITLDTLLAYARKTATTATLTVELVAKEWQTGGPDKLVKLSSLNTAIAAHGIAPFPDKITVGGRDDRAFIELLDRVELVNEKLDRHLELQRDWDPSEYVGLCYTGPLSQVGAVVENQRNAMFSDYMGIQAWRWKTTKKVFIEFEGGEQGWLTAAKEELGHDAEVDAWKNFNTSSNNFLMMTDGGQQGDGTELFAVTIRPCP